MTVTICIPAYNEEKIIGRTLQTIHSFCDLHPEHTWNIVVANNGSTDRTLLYAREVKDTRVLEVPVRGKGAAVVYAAQQDYSDVFCFIDADLSAHPTSLPKLIEEINCGADIAIGSRLLEKRTTHRSFFRTLSSSVFNAFRKLILGVTVSDSQCGLKAMNPRGRALLAAGKETGWFFDMELLATAQQRGLRVREVPIPWEETLYPERTSKLNIIRDGFRGILAMFRIRSRLKTKDAQPTRPAYIPLLVLATIVYSTFALWYGDIIRDSGIPHTELAYERGDSMGYVAMADSINRGDSSLVLNDELTRGLRTPGYPIFLAALFSFTREPFVIIIAQIILAIVTVPFIYSIGRTLTSPRIAFWATVAFILYPTTAFLNTQILSETLFMFFSTLSVWLLLSIPKDTRLRYVAIGLATGVTILIRPIFMYMLPLFALYLLLHERTSWQKTLISCGTITIGAFLIVAPWLHANARDFGNPALSTAGNFNILYVYLPQFLAQREEAIEGWLPLAAQFMQETRATGHEPGSHRATAYESTKIHELLAEKYLSYSLFHIKRSILTLASSGLKMVNNEFSELGRPLFAATPWIVQYVYTHGISLDLIRNNAPTFGDALLSAGLAVLGPFGVLFYWMRRDPRFWGLMVLLGIIIVTALIAGPNGNARYRMPVQPYIFLLAFTAIATTWNRFRHTS